MSDVRITVNRLPEIAARFAAETTALIAETAFAIEGEWKIRAPVDTGTYRASIIAEIETPTRAVVSSGVEYAPYLEYGTARMAAQPSLTPAVDAERRHFTAKARALARRL